MVCTIRISFCPSLRKEDRMFVISLIIAAGLIAVDQIIKIIVNANLEIGSVVEVVKFGDFKLFSLNHVRNSGAAWSIMEGKTWFLIGLPVVICALGVYYMYRQRNSRKLQLVSLAMLIAGGLGNLIDRIRLKEVIDYIKFEPFNFPVFNFADICVVVGAILFAVYIIFLDDSGKKSTETENEKTEDTVKAAEENDD